MSGYRASVELEATYEICGYLENPIGLHKDNRSDVEDAGFSPEKRLVLYPGNDIMEAPANI